MKDLSILIYIAADNNLSFEAKKDLEELQEIVIRTAKPSDLQKEISIIPNWWGGRNLSASVSRVFLIHFCNTLFIAEKDKELVGFLVGFLSQTDLNEACIHFTGVHPNRRKQGLGRTLYLRFFKVCKANSRTIVRVCTSIANKMSIGLH